MKEKIRVGILGATGAVGQKFVELLDDHPWFRVTALVASERSAGKSYGDAVNWMGRKALPEWIKELTVGSSISAGSCDLLFSGLDASVAGEMESEYARAGFPVVSNARNHRMDPDIPLVIPEVNPDHVELIERQKTFKPGFIVTNPNCATVGLVVPLKPIYDAFGLNAVHVTTMQALSGAGYPGVPALDIVGNVVPFIRGEEEKVETEPLKLLGRLGQEGVEDADIRVSAQCNRVPVVDGHLLNISFSPGARPSIADLRECLRSYVSPIQTLNLPFAPEPLLHLFDDASSPQPVRHAGFGGGMTVSVGRLRPCPVLGYRFVALVHNTIRGAAGGAVLNAEYLTARGLVAGNVS